MRTVHYSKNIELNDGYTSRYVINELNKIDVNKRFDFEKTRYPNDGVSVVAHTKAHEYIIYDKIADLEKKKKRAIDKVRTSKQQSLFADFEKLERPREDYPLRIRLNEAENRRAIPRPWLWPSPTFKVPSPRQKAKRWYGITGIRWLRAMPLRYSGIRSQ